VNEHVVVVYPRGYFHGDLGEEILSADKCDIPCARMSFKASKTPNVYKAYTTEIQHRMRRGNFVIPPNASPPGVETNHCRFVIHRALQFRLVYFLFFLYAKCLFCLLFFFLSTVHSANKAHQSNWFSKDYDD
jgi:hypothetical protein